MKCTNCQTQLPENAKFCPSCGAPAPTVCPVCKKEIATQAKFCHHCGAALQPQQSIDIAQVEKQEEKSSSFEKHLTDLNAAGNYEEILALCKAEISKNPNDEKIYDPIADLLAEGTLSNAKELLKQLKNEFPDNIDISMLLILFFMQQEEWEQVLVATEDALRCPDKLDNEDKAHLYFWKFNILANIKDDISLLRDDLHKAEDLKNYLSKEEQNILNFNKGLYLLNEDKPEEARCVAEEILNNDPEDIQGRYLRALSFSDDKEENIDLLLQDIEAVSSCPKASEEMKQGVKNLKKILLDGFLPLDNDFIINFYQSFHKDIHNFFTIYKEEKNLHTCVGLFSAAKITRLTNDAIHNAFSFLRHSTQAIKTDELEQDISAKENGLIQKAQQDMTPFLDELPRLKQQVLDNTSDSSLSDFVGGAIKGATLGWLGAVDAFLDGNKKDKLQEQTLQEWDSNVQEIAEIMDNIWIGCLTVLEELIEKYPLRTTWADNVLDNFLAEQSGENSPLLTLLQEAAAGNDDYYFTPDIPAEKLGEAKKAYAFIQPDEKILCLFDSTVFGGADDGVVFTDQGIYWHELMEDPKHLDYRQIHNIFLRQSNLTIKTVSGESLQMSFLEEENKLLKNLINAVIQYLKEENAHDSRN
ncbi:MAG: zinc-ribbon domain-containing protein [Candidatus Avelusimicrobium sp.]|uniref:zinc-ribbon domain-containing protein n=1 Tax=Candidatus Avelusimicrobium sp. TaxID=3048833 RepID=UPI003F0C610A